MMFLLLMLLITIWSTMVGVEATGNEGRVDPLWTATQALQAQLEELKAANAMLEQEIVQIEEVGSTH
jgi:cell division protein FtsB